jgi:hypothetical protein
MGMKIVQLIWKAVWRFLKKLKLCLPFHPSTPPLGIHQKESKPVFHRSTATVILIAILLTIAKLCKSPDALQLMNGLRKCAI